MLLMTTVDDLPPESLPYIIDRTLEKGANNIHILNAITKKGRMEHVILVDVDEIHQDDVCSLLALEFGTLGIKTLKYDHVKFPYEIDSKTVYIKTDNNLLEMEIRVKFVKKDGKIISLKAEYDDLQAVTLKLNSKGINMPLSKLKSIIEADTYKEVLKNENITIEIK